MDEFQNNAVLWHNLSKMRKDIFLDEMGFNLSPVFKLIEVIDNTLRELSVIKFMMLQEC